VVFSKDRPLQLDAVLTSLELNFADLGLARVCVLYTTSSDEYEALYRTVAAEHRRTEFRRESDFKADLIDLAAGSRFLMFVVDDTLFVGAASVGVPVRVLQADKACLGFSYRLGRNTTYCYPKDREQRLPGFRSSGEGTLTFDWPGADADFGYPLELSSSLYRSSDMAPLLGRLRYRNPNTLEGELARVARTLARRMPCLACYEQSVAFSVPANMVQTTWQNRFDGRPELDPQSLAREFALGRRLDVGHYRGHVARAAHEELPFVYTQRPAVPAVSVVIPCYNQAEFLGDAVESVVGQSFTDWEVVIVDDGSPDRTAEVAEGLARRHPDRHIRIVRQQNSGPARARNAGIEQARGSYVLPLDADDRIAPEMLARTHALLEERPDVSIAYTDCRCFGAEDSVVAAGSFDAWTLPTHNQLGYCALYRREVWEGVGGYNPNMSHGFEDWDFWVGALEHGFTAVRIPEPLFLYRVREGTRTADAEAHRSELRSQIRLNHPALYRWDKRLRRRAGREVRRFVSRISGRGRYERGL
jgi:glycosyltransferase involved in cell wall biosynthesis